MWENPCMQTVPCPSTCRSQFDFSSLIQTFWFFFFFSFSVSTECMFLCWENVELDYSLL